MLSAVIPLLTVIHFAALLWSLPVRVAPALADPLPVSCTKGVRRQLRPSFAAPEEFPAVTVQLPLYNERFVAERLLDAAARLDWPAERLEIQVLDDSDDDTCHTGGRAGCLVAAAGCRHHRGEKNQPRRLQGRGAGPWPCNGTGRVRGGL